MTRKPSWPDSMFVDLRTSIRSLIRRSHEVRDLLSWRFSDIDLDDLGPRVSVEEFACCVDFDPDDLVEDIRSALSGTGEDDAWLGDEGDGDGEDEEELEPVWDEEADLSGFTGDGMAEESPEHLEDEFE